VSQSARHIFIVDDEVLITESLSLILGRRGFLVSSFNNPMEALEQMRCTPPDLLISDVAMPQLSGVDLAIQVRKMRPECRILLFSGQAATLDLLRAARKQGHNFRLLQKPMHPEELIEEIDLLEVDRPGTR
jgi:DNA-binding NtrC family response regulator